MFDLKKNNFGTLKIRKKYNFTHTKTYIWNYTNGAGRDAYSYKKI